MKKIFLLLIYITIFAGCDKPIYEQITADEAHEMISKKDVIILDVREDNEFNQGHLENAINIPFDELEDRFMKEVTSDKDQIIILYCRSGHRAMIGAETLASLGFTNLYTFGSIDDWEYEIVK